MFLFESCVYHSYPSVKAYLIKIKWILLRHLDTGMHQSTAVPYACELDHDITSFYAVLFTFLTNPSTSVDGINLTHIEIGLFFHL